MNRLTLWVCLGGWLSLFLGSGPARAQGLEDTRWIGEEVLPKLVAMKTKADQDLVSAGAKIRSAQKTIQKAEALEAQYQGLGDSTGAEGAKQVEEIGKQTLEKARAWKERVLLNQQRAEKAIESVTYTLAHHLGSKANAVASGVTGDVKISREGKFRDLYGTNGDFLVPGDKIETGADGRIDLVMKDGHKVHLEPHSTLTLEKEDLSFLAEGILAARRLLIEKYGKKFEVRTPSAVLGVRGTEYTIDSTMDGTAVEVHEGSVEVWDLKKTQSVGVEAGFKVFVPKDGQPGTPEKDDHWKTLDWDAPIAGE